MEYFKFHYVLFGAIYQDGFFCEFSSFIGRDGGVHIGWAGVKASEKDCVIS